MAGRRWTREELADLVRGRFVGARNLQAADVPPPAWLVEHARGLWAFDSAESLEHLHPDDRSSLIHAFLECASTPGEVVSVVCRGRAMGDWHWRKSSWLNLVDDEDIGVILFTVEEVAGPAFELPPDEAVGEHSSTRWMLWTLSDTGYVRDVEGASVELLGYEPDEIVGHHATAFIPANAVADGIAMWVELQKGQRNMATNRRHWTRRDGSHIWLEDSYLHRVGPDGQPVVLAVMWDATDRMVQEEALRDREEELRALAAEKQALAGDFKLLADELPAAVFRCDAAGFVLFHNARWSELVETRDGVPRLHDVVARSDHAALDQALAEVAQADSAQRRALEVACAGQAARMWRVSLRGTGDGDSGSLVGSIEDVSATVRLRREARQDPLTGLPNRAALDRHLAAALVEDPGDVLVCFVDLDGFKAVNDTWGHEAGDVVLTEVGRRLRAGVRPADEVGRYGGDEFVIVCVGARSTPPAAVTARLAVALGGDIPFAGGTWEPSASIGWARGQAGDDIAALVRRADLEMLERKRARSTRSAR